MRVKVFFGGREAADVVEAVKPAEPLLVNDQRSFMVVLLTQEKVEELTGMGYKITPDKQYDIELTL